MHTLVSSGPENPRSSFLLTGRGKTCRNQRRFRLSAWRPVAAGGKPGTSIDLLSSSLLLRVIGPEPACREQRRSVRKDEAWPRYLADIVQPTSSRVMRSGLRSLSETDSNTTPRLHTKFRERAFSVLRPSIMELSPCRTTHHL